MEFTCQIGFKQMNLIDMTKFPGLHNRKQPWNPYADKANEKTAPSQDSVMSDSFHMPKSSHEFQKYWRRCQKDKVKKYQYLTTVGGPMLAEVFQAEIPMGFLGEIVDILNENWTEGDSSKIYNILYKLGGVQRFSLSLKFLSCRETEALVELFEKLNKVIVAGEDGEIECLRALERKYGIDVQ